MFFGFTRRRGMFLFSLQGSFPVRFPVRLTDNILFYYHFSLQDYLIKGLIPGMVPRIVYKILSEGLLSYEHAFNKTLQVRKPDIAPKPAC